MISFALPLVQTTSQTPRRSDCEALDATDALAPLRGLFAVEPLDAAGVIYLDGNSLGAMPTQTLARVQEVVRDEWGVGLIRSWNQAGWYTLSTHVAGKIADVIGASPADVVVGDSTSINLHKALSAAFAVRGTDIPARRFALSERDTFPSDLYIAESVARAHGLELALADTADIASQLDDRVAVLLLTHVNYRTGRMHDMRALTVAAHAVGALVIWDLAHSAGVVPINVHGGRSDEAVDFAVGCGYKYLNGGPGAPAFLWIHPRHTQQLQRDSWRPPLAGWFGHADPFAFTTEYRPAAGVGRFLCGTPPILSLAALECGVDTVCAARAFGGAAALRTKSIALTELFIALVEARCADGGLRLVTPRRPEERGSQVSFATTAAGYAIMQALIDRGVIGDFRAPDILRFGFAPLYTRYVDVWDAVDRLRDILHTGAWRDPRYAVRQSVT
jgi:kynureninase